MMKKNFLKILGIFVFVVFIITIFVHIVSKKEIVDLSLISSGDTQVVAILDTGYSSTLIDENKNNIVKMVNVNDGSENIDDKLGHGTALTTLLLGSKSMNLNGLLPKVQVILIKITDEHGKCSFKNLLKGLTIAEENKANIINISLGGDISNEEVSKKINDLYKKGITVVSASGDYGDKDLLFPANLSTVISVASLDNKYNLSKFSNYNERVTCSFQGENLEMISVKDGKLEKTKELYGTSYATIYASAYVAVIKDYAIKHNLNLSNEKIFDIMKANNPFKNKKVITDTTQIFN